MRRPHIDARLTSILLVTMLTLLTCSKDDTSPLEPNLNPTTLTVAPSSGAPGTLLSISGYTVNPDDTATEVYIGGELSVLAQDSSGIQSMIPLFLDSATHWPAPPSGAIDVEIRKNGNVVARATAAVTVDSLKHADGSTEMLRQDFIKLTGSLRVIYSSLPTVPGEDPRLPGYRDAILAMLDSLTSASDSSLGAVLTGTSSWNNNQTPDMSLMDALLASSGALDFFNEAAGSLGRLTDSLTLARQQGVFCRGGGEDMDLACQMQIFVVLDDYANYFVKPTTTTYANTVGLAAGLIALSGVGVPAEAIVGVLMTVFDLVYGTIAPSLFPAEISEFSLTVATDTVAVDELTNTAVLVSAINHPASISATQVLDLLLKTLGLTSARSTDLIKSATEFLKNAMSWALGMYRDAVIQSNTQSGGAIFIDPTADIPQMSWGPVMVTNSDLVELYSFTEDIITGNEAEFEWQGVTRGEGRIQARGRGSGERSKVLIDNALCWGCVYSGGAFGNNAPGTETKTVVVGRPATLDMQITGLPTGTDASVIVTGPDGYLSGTLTGSKTLKDLDPGDYHVTAIDVQDGTGEKYTAEPIDTTVTLTDGDNKTVEITYHSKYGSMLVTVSGLSQGSNADITVSGPNGGLFYPVSDTLIDSLIEGDYTITAQEVVDATTGKTLSPAPQIQTVTVIAGETALAGINYKSRYGAIRVNVKIRRDIQADIDIDGDSLSRHVGRSTIIGDVYEGSYSVIAYDVPLDSFTTLKAIPAAQGVSVTGGDTVEVEIRYTAPLQITWAYGPSENPLGRVTTRTFGDSLEIDTATIDESLSPPGYIVNEHCAIIGPNSASASASASASTRYSSGRASINISGGGTSGRIDVNVEARASFDASVNGSSSESKSTIGFGSSGNFFKDTPIYSNDRLASGLHLQVYNPAHDPFTVNMNYDFNVNSDDSLLIRYGEEALKFTLYYIDIAYTRQNYNQDCGMVFYKQDTSCTGGNNVDCWRGGESFSDIVHDEGIENFSLFLGGLFSAEARSSDVSRNATMTGTITINVIQ